MEGIALLLALFIRTRYPSISTELCPGTAHCTTKESTVLVPKTRIRGGKELGGAAAYYVTESDTFPSPLKLAAVNLTL
jgi:hypothetical protein